MPAPTPSSHARGAVMPAVERRREHRSETAPPTAESGSARPTSTPRPASNMLKSVIKPTKE